MLLTQVGGDAYSHSIQYVDHHLSHASSAFYPSPFEKAAILTIDGVGEYATTTYSLGERNLVSIQSELTFPHSVGLLYSAFTYYLGFRVNSDEYKVMGLAPYGKPRNIDQIENEMISWLDDGSFALNPEYFGTFGGDEMITERFLKVFDEPKRRPESKLTQAHCDIAASVQAITEKAVLRLASHIAEVSGNRNLCLAGGVALNCVANGKLLRSGIFDQIWIQPAAGDAGGALGAALYTYFSSSEAEQRICGTDKMSGAFLGPSYKPRQIKSFLKENSYPFTTFDSRNELNEEVCRLLVEEKVVGWFTGRMEFGPRALGHRSIIADPRSPRMQTLLNLKIKYRESFRPFAPSVLEEHVGEFFELEGKSPYMLIVADVVRDRRLSVSENTENQLWSERLKVPRSDIPAVTHVDYSARVHTVNKDVNPEFYDLLECFFWATGYPVLVNTSFNVRDEPIVCSPQDAYRCFMRTEMDVLVLEEIILLKEEQPLFIN